MEEVLRRHMQRTSPDLVPASVQFSELNVMDTGRERCDHYTVLSVRFENDLSCSTNRNRRLFGLVGKPSFATEGGFLQSCRLLVLVCEQASH